MLDLLRPNQAAVRQMVAPCHSVLRKLSVNLQICKPGNGQENLIRSVEVEEAKLVAMLRRGGCTWV